MEISLLKKPSTVKVQSKNVTIALDPEGEAKADVVLLSTEADYKAVENQMVFSHAGEYEVRNTMIDGVQLPSGTAYAIESDGVRVVHLANAANQITDEQQEAISPADILVLPTVDAKAEDVAKLVSVFEPRIIIPVGSDAAMIKALGAEFGITPESVSKLKVAAKDLPQDSQKLVVLE